MLISDEEYVAFKNWMREYIDRYCIARAGKEIDYLLHGKKPGEMYTWQFYLRRGLFDPVFLSVLSQMFIYKIEREIGHFNFQLSGLETGSTPMLAAIPLVAKGYGINLNSFVVRKEQKTYGLKNWIEGRPIMDKPVLLIDDMCNSSGSLSKAKWYCEHLPGDQPGLEVLKVVFTIVNKWSKVSDKDSHENYTRQIPDTKVIHFFNCDDWDLFTKSYYTHAQYEKYKALYPEASVESAPPPDQPKTQINNEE